MTDIEWTLLDNSVIFSVYFAVDVLGAPSIVQHPNLSPQATESDSGSDSMAWINGSNHVVVSRTLAEIVCTRDSKIQTQGEPSDSEAGTLHRRIEECVVLF